MFIHLSNIGYKNLIDATGLMATLIGIISFLPVLYLIYQTKNTANFPYQTLFLAILSNLLWIFYATHKSSGVDTQIAFMGCLYLCIYSYIFYTKVRY